MARGPKSHHADGTPKKRWTAEQRAARGRAPRRRGGRLDDEFEPRNRAERRARQFADLDDRSSKRRTGGKQQPKQRWEEPHRKGKSPKRGGEGTGRDEHQDKPWDSRAKAPNKVVRNADSPAKRGNTKAPKRWEGKRQARGFEPEQRFEKPRRHDGKPPKRWDKPQRRFEKPRRHDERPEPDQMAWEATTIAAQEGVVNGFTELGVADEIVGVLAAEGITQPFAIQEATIRDAIEGRDVLGRARTGSGKTLAFGLPLLTRLAAGHGQGPRALILSPTRELALQIADNLAPLAACVGLDLTLVAGGMSYNPQIKAFARGVDVVVATPGRLIDLMEQGAADLSNVEITVLDEADHMAEMGFTDEVTSILDATPERGQRLLFSATLDDAVDRIVKRYLNDPITHEVDSGQASVTTMTHLALQTKPHEKIAVTAELASREGRTVIFARTQKGTDRIAGQLREAGVMAGALHGGLTQGARARILAAFKAGDVPVLVATDVAARGIHVDDVSLVVQVDPPRDSKDYLHRAGRTARAGTDGTVATVVLPHQRKLMRRLLGQAGVEARNVDARPGDETVAELTGARPASGEAVEESAYLDLIKPKQQARRSGQRRQGFRGKPRRFRGRR